ncbi:MAG: hypothetical protein ACRDPY_21215 [Streptosporangiaceae bacterium]
MTGRTPPARGPADREAARTAPAAVTQLADWRPAAQFPGLPTRADLDAATAATAAAIADPASGPAGILRSAQAEEAVHLAYLRRPGAAAELEAGL